MIKGEKMNKQLENKISKIKEKNKGIAFIVYKRIQIPLLNKYIEPTYTKVTEENISYNKLIEDFKAGKILDVISYDPNFSEKIQKSLKEAGAEFQHIKEPVPICNDCLDSMEMDEPEM